MFYIEYKDKTSGQIHKKYFNYQPNVKDTCCPKCKNRVMEQKWITHPIAEVEINYECLHCGTVYEEDDIGFVRVNNTGRLITNVDIYETYDEEVVSNNDYFCEDDLGSVATGLKNAKDKKVNITSDEKDMEVSVITPQPRNIRYTPEFIEKATKAMRDTPLKRQNIHIHEDDMESTCPACGYMLYEEANMIFNYCPTCGQALNNNDFSEDGE